MKNCLSGMVLAGLALLATPATASQILVTVNGTLTSSRGEGNPLDSLNNGIDPNLAVGDVLTLTASFDSSLLLDAGGGTQRIGMYGAPISAGIPTFGFLNGADGTFFRIDAPGMTWQSKDDEHDGFPPFSLSPREASPIIYIQGDKVIGLALILSPVGQVGRPDLFGGGGSQFSIDAPHGLYNNIYNTPGFNGAWDFANSSVAVVPEPATWSLFLLGFGGIGWLMRRRRNIPLLGAKPV